jgi:hypothetical protein
MGDEVLARLAALVGVVLAGEEEGAQDRLAIDRVDDLVGVLGDDREEVGEQLVLERRQVVRNRQRAVVTVLGAIDGTMRSDRDRRFDVEKTTGGLPPRRPPAERPVAVGAVQAAARLGLLLIRYCWPSSNRRW